MLFFSTMELIVCLTEMDCRVLLWTPMNLTFGLYKNKAKDSWTEREHEKDVSYKKNWGKTEKPEKRRWELMREQRCRPYFSDVRHVLLSHFFNITAYSSLYGTFTDLHIWILFLWHTTKTAEEKNRSYNEWWTDVKGKTNHIHVY